MPRGGWGRGRSRARAEARGWIEKPVDRGRLRHDKAETAGVGPVGADDLAAHFRRHDDVPLTDNDPAVAMQRVGRPAESMVFPRGDAKLVGQFAEGLRTILSLADQIQNTRGKVIRSHAAPMIGWARA